MNNLLICSAQINAKHETIQESIEHHVEFIRKAINIGADLIFFPELSLTGYNLNKANENFINQDDIRLKIFSTLACNNNLHIIIGLALSDTSNKKYICSNIYKPDGSIDTYKKMFLHPGEEKFYDKGNSHYYLLIKKMKLALAICYDINKEEHYRKIAENNCDIYLASVLFSKANFNIDAGILSKISYEAQMIAIMSNFIGIADKYQCAGKSSVWDTEGLLNGRLNDDKEGILSVKISSEKKITEIKKINI